MTRIGAKARAILTGITLVACLGAGQAGTVSRPEHVAWSLAWHASLPYGNSLVSVTSTGTGDIWALGLGFGHHADYAVHWNGRRWHLLRFPDPSFIPGVVSASSPGNVWVTGTTPQSPELAAGGSGRHRLHRRIFRP